MLRCSDGTIYTGCTNDLARRLRAHQAGQVKYTRGRLPVEAVFQEAAHDRSAALSREAQLKRLRREQKLRAIGGATPRATENDQSSRTAKLAVQPGRRM